MAILNIERPEPGVYAGVSFEEYRKIKAINHSLLRHMEKSPAHFRYEELHGENNETSSKRFGSAVHALLLEPAKFANSIIPAPINPKTEKPYGGDTKAWQEFASQHPGKVVMTDDEIKAAKNMATAIHQHNVAGPELRKKGASEVVMVWQEGPILCKGRVDRISADFRIDLKTTSGDARWDRWRSSVLEYSYWTQDAFYARGAAALDLQTRGMFVVVESAAPHGVTVCEIETTWASIGDEQVTKWLNQLAHCRETGVYPSYPDTRIEVIPPPAWFMALHSEGD